MRNGSVMIYINNKTSRFVLVSLFCVLTSQAAIETTYADFKYKFSGKLKEDTVAAKNLALLNNNNDGNKIWFARHTLDLDLNVGYGKETFGDQVAAACLSVRNKGIWGSPQSIASTTVTSLKFLDSVGLSHNHEIPRYFFWIRELWLDFSINTILGLPLEFEHSFKLGLFPFQLGRGIALGDAYAVGPEILGYYNDSLVDQFAPGGILQGEILRDVLSYDLYAGILQNRSTSLSETGAAVFGQEYGRLDTPQQGSGSINFLIAGRLNWDVFNNEKLGKLHAEPYFLYDRDPEQRIEFLADALGQLGTVGFADEYTYPRFEIGFDYALNLGQQRIRGWDRNRVDIENNGGYAVVVNSQVVDQNGNKIPYIKGSPAQKMIDLAWRDESQNNQAIGTVDGGVGYLTGPVTLKNAETRFRCIQE